MDQLFMLLRAAGENPLTDQRSLAADSGLSVGKVNGLLRAAEEGGYLAVAREGKKSRYTLTRKGKDFLENTLLSRQEQKLHPGGHRRDHRHPGGRHRAGPAAAGAGKQRHHPVYRGDGL